VVAGTGLRISEAIALRRKDVIVSGSQPHIRVRRAIVKRRVQPPKTRHGKRNVPLAQGLVHDLRLHLQALDGSPDALVFPSGRGTALDPDTLRRVWLRALMEEVGAHGCGFHALRHTYASLQLAGGANLLQLSRVLGHHSPAFTLSVYCHLLEGDQPPALDLDKALAVAPAGDDPVVTILASEQAIRQG
jgi:integrase